jgi:hypothetical protein
MAVNIMQESLMYAAYFAPRGKRRLLNLGYLIAQRHLSPLDRLIGFIGEIGAGKSILIRGMFPGLELTNDESGINVRPLPLIMDNRRGFFSAHTYHVDIRFEMAFNQLYEIGDAIKAAVQKDKRVIVEHFELIYPILKMNAEMLIGIGEEVIVTRPNIFGPLPEDIAGIVFKSIILRRMAHTAEDLTCMVIEKILGHSHPLDYSHGDVKHGFVLGFSKRPNVEISEVEKYVNGFINKGLNVSYVDDNHIRIGDDIVYHCTGPRIHVNNTSLIENFHLISEYKYNEISKKHNLVGIVGSERYLNVDDLNKLVL